MTELITDQKKFRKLKKDLPLKRERALERTLCEISKKYIFSEIEYSNLYPKAIKPARLYGTPKTHTKLSCQVLFLLFDLLSL